MFTITDYYNLLDFKGDIIDAIKDYNMPFSELINGLYNNFIDNTTKADQQTAHKIIKDMYHASESSKQHILELVNMWAYDSISHGI
ncbi:hypothetical protein [Leuconostoc pseudomesenteroides]|uniref:hypothetical protein n=1 Tax=Leuconostoc pseudomesenteroides TaxID=33968 RepID=UPI00112045F7|nr:hypothetical protein [Leuconostoc pseudomesenteroides]TOZ06264.1 hypothetical protein DIS14_05320 [Leuconostoc pseudomesenteroides]